MNDYILSIGSVPQLTLIKQGSRSTLAKTVICDCNHGKGERERQIGTAINTLGFLVPHFSYFKECCKTFDFTEFQIMLSGLQILFNVISM